MVRTLLVTGAALLMLFTVWGLITVALSYF